jgi:serine/threonine-protein kinase
MASVYEAVHRNGNRVAIKMLHPHLSINADLRSRFLREGYAANRVNHQGAVRVLDDDMTEDGSVFLVMELLKGETLDARWETRGSRLAHREVCEHAHQLLDVLAAAHGQGVVHRDIKPENLFLTTDGVLKVLDFGIARLRDASGAEGATQTGRMIGTPAFMPPEQALGRSRQIDGQTDLWAVGATMFTLVSGGELRACSQKFPHQSQILCGFVGCDAFLFGRFARVRIGCQE